MDHTLTDAPPLIAEPDELEAFQFEVLGFVHTLLDFHCRGRSIAEARIILAKLSGLVREEIAHHGH